VLLKPPCALRTAEVYAEFDRTGEEPAEGQKLRVHSSHDLIRTEMRPPRGWKRLLRRANVEPGEAEAKGKSSNMSSILPMILREQLGSSARN
jgi:hypothetical protein